MIYKFIGNKGTFQVKNPHKYGLYFPLTDKDGTLLSSISPNLAGDIKKDNNHFLTAPISFVDIKSNLLARRDFFIKTPKETIRLSKSYKDTLEAGFLYHKIIKETKSLNIEILNFIPHNLAVEIMRIKVINKSNKPIEITPTSFIPLYGRGEKNLRDHRHVSSLLNRIYLDKYGIFLKPTMIFDEKGHSANEITYFVLGFQDDNLPPLGQFPTLEYFCGDGDLANPRAIEKNIPPVNRKLPSFDGKEACAAFRFRKKELKINEEVNYFLIMGLEKNRQKIKNTFESLNSPKKIESHLEETKKYWSEHLSPVQFDFGNRNFNNWLLWVKLQPSLRKLFGCSFLPHFDYGKGGRGWRDLWQDTLALLFNQPQQAEKLILNNFKGVRIDGSNATIITKEGNFLSDRNCIPRVWMDHGIWPYLTLRLYINRTGNLDILLKDISYFKDYILRKAEEINYNFSQKDYFLHTKDNKIYEGSILEHVLIQTLTSFFNVGSHNIIRLENADWNDGLDMAKDEGESVAFSFMYAHNLNDICFFLEKLKEKTKTIFILKELMLLLDRLDKPVDYNKQTEKQLRLEEYLEKTENVTGEKIKISIDDLIYDLKEKSEHLFRWLKKNEWLDAGFFNGYYDNKGKQVEGKLNGRVNLMLASQVFPIMSGGADKKQIKKIWVSIKRYLQDKKLKGFRLNTNFGSLYLDLGRAFGFSFGDKENGAFFNHMTVMLGYSLYKQGFTKEGFEVINSIYKMAASPQAEIYPAIPEYFNLQGKGLYHYLTGSASWYIYALLEEILGIKFTLGDIFLEPKLFWGNFFNHSIKIKFIWEEKKIKLWLMRGKKKNELYQIKSVVLEGEKVPHQNNRYIIKKEVLLKIKKKEITIKVLLE